MKQTAVEYFIEQLQELNMFKINSIFFKELCKQAEEMEREQIIEAHGNKLKRSRDTGNYEYWFTGLDYYYKTFKKTEQ